MTFSDVVSLGAWGLGAIEDLLGDSDATRAADQTLAAIKQIVGSLNAASSGKVTPDAARAEIGRILAARAANNAAADAIAEAKP